MKRLLALSLGLTLLVACKPVAAPTQAGLPSPSASVGSAANPASSGDLNQVAADVASLMADLESAGSMADSEMSTQAEASLGMTRIGDVAIKPNADGSITYTLKATRTNSLGVARNLTVETVRKLGRFVSRTTKTDVALGTGATSSAEQVVTANGANSRSVKTVMTTTLANGQSQKVELAGTRSAGSGTAAYNATGTLTQFDGTTVPITVSVSATGSVQVSVTDAGVTVNASASASGDVSAS